MGLSYTVQFSNDLTTWLDSSDTPTVLETQGDIELVSVKYPFFLPDFSSARFFRVVVNVTP
jgi:hypothetical protein